MLGEMVKNSVGQGFLFHAIIPTHNTFCWKYYELNLYPPASLNLNYGTTK